MKKTGYYIFYNNGLDYEDRDWSLLCVAKTESAAKKEVARLNEWIKEAQKKLDKIIHPDPNDEIDIWNVKAKSKDEKIKEIKIPYENMRECLRCYSNVVQGSVGYAKTIILA